MLTEQGDEASHGGRPRNTRWRVSPTTSPLPCCFILLLLFISVTGCRIVQTAADVPGHTVRAVTPGRSDKESIDPIEMQQNLLRFADEFFAHMVLGVEKLQRGTNVTDRADVLRWKIAVATEISAIASGPNAVANVLDMTVFVTMTRTTLEELSQPAKFGESARPLLETCRIAETNIWQATSKALKPEQQAELRQATEVWRQRNMLPGALPTARAHGFTSQVAETGKDGATKNGSVFSLLMVDPFAGMDPAVREIARTRMFAERALFVTQKMPMLLRWHTELMTVNTVELPAVQQLVTNSTQIAASVDRFARVAEQLPGQLSAEREQIIKALESQEKQLTPLVLEVRQTLTAGSQMSTSLNTTLITFDALMKRFGVGETNRTRPAGTNSKPFRVLDYGEAAGQVEAAAKQLNGLLLTLDQTLGSTNLAQLSSQVGPAVQQVQISGKELVNFAFWKGVLLLAIALVMALVYRFLTRGLKSCASPKSPST